jgi:hypothetical protein
MNEVRVPSSIEDRLRRLLTPLPFFVGMILGLALCCWAGRKAPKAFVFHHFQRFYRAIDPESNYFPTALQVRALARQQLPPDKIAVIIGGSSILQGVGQAAKDLWTVRLQELLGDDYRVLNLAMPGGAPNEYGQLAAEMLCRDHPKIIVLGDCGPQDYADFPDGTRDWHRYFFHDAQARGLLLPLAEREAALAALAPGRYANENLRELELQTAANRWLSFNDLWNVIGYQWCFTAWESLNHAHFWQPRRLNRDRTPTAILPSEKAVTDAQYQDYLRQVVLPAGPDDLRTIENRVRQSVPEALRPKTLVVVPRCNPDNLAVLAAELPGFSARYDDRIQQTLAHLRACGLHAVEGCTTLDRNDYLDVNHHKASGGAKLADELAPVIRDMARRLGYE